ncbi:MAG: hypothetical protein RR825_04245, partial [Ruthenibacterium sp.]
GSGGKKSSGKKSSGGKKDNEADEPEAPDFSSIEQAIRWAQEATARLNSDYLPSILAWSSAYGDMRAAALNAFSSVRDSAMSLWKSALEPLGSYLLHDFLPSVANGFSTTFAPIFADVAEAAMHIFADGFARACTVAQDAVNTLVLPALELVKTVFTDLCTAVANTWDTYGAGLIEGVQTAFGNLFSLLQSLYTEILQPIFAAVIEMLTVLWQEHLAPLWQNLTMLVAEIGTLLLTLWNEVLAPLGQYLIETLGPCFAALSELAAQVFGDLAGGIADAVNGIILVLRGLCTFLLGVFTGDWSRAWEGVKTIFGGIWTNIVGLLKGAVNSIIDVVNAMTRGVASALNGVIRGLNSIHVTIPAWVPAYGGQSFGVNLPSVSAPQIPHLARGAVIPPNAEFLALLGDQKSGRNLEAPEDLLRQIVREETGAQHFTAQQPVELSLDGDIFYRAMLRIEAARGVQIGGAFANAY